MGQLVKTTRINNSLQVIRLDVSELPKGIYLLKITKREEVHSANLVIM
jgi:hypothetical protein